jgi:hypothetical protein
MSVNVVHLFDALEERLDGSGLESHFDLFTCRWQK